MFKVLVNKCQTISKMVFNSDYETLSFERECRILNIYKKYNVYKGKMKEVFQENIKAIKFIDLQACTCVRNK